MSVGERPCQPGLQARQAPDRVRFGRRDTGTVQLGKLVLEVSLGCYGHGIGMDMVVHSIAAPFPTLPSILSEEIVILLHVFYLSTIHPNNIQKNDQSFQGRVLRTPELFAHIVSAICVTCIAGA